MSSHFAEADAATLSQRLAVCHQLVQQLSQELFYRVVPDRRQQQVWAYLLVAQTREWQRLKTRFQQYEQLIQQLSQELFCRLGQERQLDPAAVATLQAQVHHLQTELKQREQELVEMHNSLQAVRERNQHLETLLRDLPELYRRRFQARLAPVKEQLSRLQEENRRLQSELQRYGALVQGTTKPQSSPSVDLPKFPPLSTVSRALS